MVSGTIPTKAVKAVPAVPVLSPAKASQTRAIERAKLSHFVERLVDGEEDFSVREFLTKLFIRKWIFVLSIVIPTLVGLGVTVLTPITWQASTKILIRYSSSESVFLKDLIPDDRVSLSGAASSEILTGLPTLEEVVRQHNIQESDLYQSTSKVIRGLIGHLFRSLLGSEKPITADEKIIALARRFQDSLQASSNESVASSKTPPIKILSSTSPIPQSVKGDELITLRVKAFNRNKVAEMTNGLAQAFIDQYYLISAEDARRSSEFLSLLASRFEAELQRLEQNPDAAVSLSAGDPRAASGAGSIVRDTPMMATLANELATLQTRLRWFQQTFKDGSPVIQRQKAAIDSIKKLFSGQERIEATKQTLEQIKERRFQALNTERLYNDHLVPISIVEPAVTPAPSSSAQISRLLVSGIMGLVIGSVLGLAVVIVLALLDQRFFTTWDLEKFLKLPVLGSLPRLTKDRRGGTSSPSFNEPKILGDECGLSQLVARLDGTCMSHDAKVVAIASASDSEGKSFVSLRLARAFARAGDCRVLLIDADLERAGLSHQLGQRRVQGRVEAAVTDRALADLIVPSGVLNIDLISAGVATEGRRISLNSRRLDRWIKEARSLYDLVIIDTPSLTFSGGALTCCMAADMILLVVKCGISRKGPIRDFLRKLREAEVTPRGVILNFRQNILPGFIYRRV
jgi:Mrp family chromosome partitioning ATPase/uncharacterized protein involved in exopolysaccharide biosynthesis